MKQLHSPEEDAVGKALYELITLFNEIDLESKKGNPDEIVLKSKGKSIKVKL